MTDMSTKDNGKEDCSGSITPPGDKVTNFIKFDPSFNLMIDCLPEGVTGRLLWAAEAGQG